MRNINMITTNATAKMFKAANAAGMVMAAKNMKKGNPTSQYKYEYIFIKGSQVFI